MTNTLKFWKVKKKVPQIQKMFRGLPFKLDDQKDATIPAELRGSALNYVQFPLRLDYWEPVGNSAKMATNILPEVKIDAWLETKSPEVFFGLERAAIIGLGDRYYDEWFNLVILHSQTISPSYAFDLVVETFGNI